MTEPAVLIENLNYTYSGGLHALKNINIRIEENELVGIIGQNGAGKSTLLQNIIGLLRPTSGKISVLGKDTKDIPVSELSTRVGFVLQNPDLQLFAQTVEEEVAFGPKNLGIEGEELEKRIDEALKLVDLENNKKDFPLALSRGDRAKVAIASVLVMQPEILILDEPTCGQDYTGCYQIMDIARRLRELGKTIIVVTHHMDLIAEYAERLIVLKKGEVFMDSSVEEVFSRPEELITTHIKPPYITQLGHELKEELQTNETMLKVGQLGDAILHKIVR